jgi:hypothetical protein
MDSWEALFERDRLSGKVAGASQDNPIDLYSLDTQEREWISAYGAREMANTQATGNSQLSEEVEMVRQKGSTGPRVPIIDLSGDEILERDLERRPLCQVVRTWKRDRRWRKHNRPGTGNM